MTRLLLASIYPLLLAARLLNALRRRDPLRLAKPPGDRFWIARAESPAPAEYFAETSQAEGRNHGGHGRLARTLLVALAGWYAPARLQPGEKFSAAADREQGIPDEVYTLW